MLTNMHEDELYTWLVNGGFGKQYTQKADFLKKIATVIAQRTTFGEFDSAKPLNVYNSITKSFAEKQFDSQVEEINSKIKELDKSIRAKSIDYKNRGASENEIYNLLLNDYGYLSRLRNQLISLMQTKGTAIEASKNELALFGLRNAIAGKKSNRPTDSCLF